MTENESKHMNPGPVEEGAKVASGVVDALKAQPFALSMVVINAALVGLLFFIGWRTSETRQREVDQFYQSQKETQELLAKCIMIAPEELLHLQPKGPPQ